MKDPALARAMTIASSDTHAYPDEKGEGQEFCLSGSVILVYPDSRHHTQEKGHDDAGMADDERFVQFVL